MPVHRGQDSEGPFYQWGNSGKKYRYSSGDKDSRGRAKALAARQGRIIQINQDLQRRRRRG